VLPKSGDNYLDMHRCMNQAAATTLHAPGVDPYSYLIVLFQVVLIEETVLGCQALLAWRFKQV